MKQIINQRKFYSLLAIALLLSLFSFVNFVQAARPDSLKDVLSDSRPSTAAVHDIYLDQSSGTTFQSAETILIDFPTGFTGVTFSATVDESLTHATAGVTTANCPNPAGAGSETEVDTSGDATTVPFGTISVNSFYGACQQLTVSTNATGGYVTTVQTTSLP